MQNIRRATQILRYASTWGYREVHTISKIRDILFCFTNQAHKTKYHFFGKLFLSSERRYTAVSNIFDSVRRTELRRLEEHLLSQRFVLTKHRVLHSD